MPFKKKIKKINIVFLRAVLGKIQNGGGSRILIDSVPLQFPVDILHQCDTFLTIDAPIFIRTLVY